MINQRIKDLFFIGTYLYSCSAYPILRLRFKREKGLFIHLGSGHKVIDDFINIDGSPLLRGTLLYDLRLKLPFDDKSIKIIYTFNVFEHFFYIRPQ